MRTKSKGEEWRQEGQMKEEDAEGVKMKNWVRKERK